MNDKNPLKSKRYLVSNEHKKRLDLLTTNKKPVSVPFLPHIFLILRKEEFKQLTPAIDNTNKNVAFSIEKSTPK